MKQCLEELTEGHPVLDGNRVFNPDIIVRIYDVENGHIGARWESRDNIDGLLDYIRGVYREGLVPEDYHLEVIEKYFMDVVSEAETIDLRDSAVFELLLTDAFLLLAAHLAGGKADPDDMAARWGAVGIMELDEWVRFFERTLEEGRVAENLAELLPSHGGYHDLRCSLAEYRDMKEEGGWEHFFTDEPELEKGMRHPDVERLRNRLASEQGDVEPDIEDEDYFDESLHEQVVLFQERHGLPADGVVDNAVVEAMNVTVFEKLDVIEANLDRWRWLNSAVADRSVRVDIAAFELLVTENEHPRFSLRAIVGTPERQTPMFSSHITHIELNPYWIVPPGIIDDDIVPAVKDDIHYLESRNMEVIRDDGTTIDPEMVDWHADFQDTFPYTIRQEPGPGNEMGTIKFVVPNPYYVTIHDTPEAELFDSTVRAFSSGCTRVEEPLRLAAWLLADDPEWTREKLADKIEKGDNHIVRLREHVPIAKLYLTAWAEDDYTAFFRDDVYFVDPRVTQALRESPPER